MSMVSVSRLAAPPHLGQVVLTNFSLYFRGDSPVGLNSASSGRSTGRSFSGTGTMPQWGQYIIGIGAPQ